MKKILAVSSLALSFAFAVVLANLNDGADAVAAPGDAVTNQQAGTAATSGADEHRRYGVSPDASANGAMSSGSSAGSDDANGPLSSDTGSVQGTGHDSAYWKSTKTCVDEKGVTFYRGKNGFSSCVERMRKRDQMSGVSGENSAGGLRNTPDSGMSAGVGHVSGTPAGSPATNQEGGISGMSPASPSTTNDHNLGMTTEGASSNYGSSR